MLRSEVINWLNVEFLPLSLATPIPAVSQIVDNAVRYLNTYSAFRRQEMVAYAGESRLQVSTNFKSVTRVLPSADTSTILTNYPMWTLLGIAILDNASADLTLMNESFKNYKYYLGASFRYTFERSADPSVGGYLYLQGAPKDATSLFVSGTKRFVLDDSTGVTDANALQFILNYSKALLKITEGNTLRKSSIIGVQNDGSELVQEGKEEKRDEEKKLSDSGKWACFAQRF